MTTTTNTNTVHVFEAANLGVGPFKLLHVTGEGGNCEFCGTSILWRFYITGSDGGTFFVGSDCVMKTGDAGLMRKVDAEVKKRQKEAREKRESEKIQTLKGLLADPTVQSKLGAMPHPVSYLAKKNLSLLDYCNWCMKYAGRSINLKNLKKIQSL